MEKDQYDFCEICEKMINKEDMYLSCHICNRQFSCFFCGVAERQKYFNGLPSKVYNGKTYAIKCKKHYSIEKEKCDLSHSC
jgi:hypothetical protein